MAMERRALALGLILMTFAGHCMGQLKVGFYDGKCNNIDIEDLIFRVVKAKYPKDIGSVGDLVRLSFHDCFVRGCDASIFLDGKGTEKTALPNLTLDGFELIDAIKATVEKFCPGVVSCADVLVIATRVLVHLAGGSWYEVETGRRDGFISNAADAFTLPPPTISISAAIQAFADKGLTLEDMVVLLAFVVDMDTGSKFDLEPNLLASTPLGSPFMMLRPQSESPFETQHQINMNQEEDEKEDKDDNEEGETVIVTGGHTVGVAHCRAFQDRLYNFQNTGKPDPSMSSSLLISLRKICPPSGNSTLTAFLDQTPGSGDVMDNAFYQAILKHNAVLRFDQLLATDPRTEGIVKTLATCPSTFSTKFGEAMVKMCRIGVLTDTQGEIRKSCRAVNKATRKLVEVDVGVDAD